MKLHHEMVILALFAASATPSAQAKEKSVETPAALRAVIDCRAVAEAAARLACYDNQVAGLEAATNRSDLVVLDREAVKKTKRSLFGFSLPRLPFFGDRDDDDKKGAFDDEISEIDAKIGSVRGLGYGKWAFSLDDGAKWQTSEAIPNRELRAGMSIHIKRAALGSYKANINGWSAVRVVRVN